MLCREKKNRHSFCFLFLFFFFFFFFFCFFLFYEFFIVGWFSPLFVLFFFLPCHSQENVVVNRWVTNLVTELEHSLVKNEQL